MGRLARVRGTGAADRFIVWARSPRWRSVSRSRDDGNRFASSRSSPGAAAGSGAKFRRRRRLLCDLRLDLSRFDDIYFARPVLAGAARLRTHRAFLRERPRFDGAASRRLSVPRAARRLIRGRCRSAAMRGANCLDAPAIFRKIECGIAKLSTLRNLPRQHSTASRFRNIPCSSFGGVSCQCMLIGCGSLAVRLSSHSLLSAERRVRKISRFRIRLRPRQLLKSRRRHRNLLNRRRLRRCRLQRRLVRRSPRESSFRK